MPSDKPVLVIGAGPTGLMASIFLVRFGLPDLPVEILAIRHWKPAAVVAHRLSQRRIFLAGGAAHRLTPGRRIWPEYRRARRAQPCLEAERCACRLGRRSFTRQL